MIYINSLLSESLFISWPCLGAYGILVPSPGLEITSPALEVWSLNHWTTQEVPSPIIFLQQHIYMLSHQSRTARTLLVQGILMIRAGCSGLWVNVNLKPPPGCRRMKGPDPSAKSARRSGGDSEAVNSANSDRKLYTLGFQF